MSFLCNPKHIPNIENFFIKYVFINIVSAYIYKKEGGDIVAHIWQGLH